MNNGEIVINYVVPCMVLTSGQLAVEVGVENQTKFCNEGVIFMKYMYIVKLCAGAKLDQIIALRDDNEAAL